ncbi:MAG: TolC family protein [Vicinamibacterales bacterium]
MTERTRRWNVPAALLLCTLAGAANASGQPVTLEHLVTEALQRSPEIRAAREAVDAARGRLTQAELRPNPVVNARDRRQLGGTDYQTMVDVEWPLDLGRRNARVEVGRQDVAAATFAVRNAERELAGRIRGQAGRWLAARRALEVMDDVLRAARDLQTLLDSRVSEGVTPSVEGSIASVELWRLEAERSLLVGEAEAEGIELKRLCGLEPSAVVTLSDSLESLVRDVPLAPPRPSDDDVTERRADMREADARVRLAAAQEERARREGGFDLMLMGGFDRMRLGFPQVGLDHLGRHVPIENVMHSVTLGAALTFPWRNRNQGTVAEAQSQRREAEALREARALAVRSELAAARARETEAKRASELYASSIRELARRNTDVMLESYTLGRNSLSELLTEQRRYLDIEAAFTDMLARAYQARVAVRLAEGDHP